MLTKHLLKISLLLPLVAISATAHAGSTIKGKSYWPSEAFLPCMLMMFMCMGHGTDDKTALPNKSDPQQ
jgi:hypothetical protein